MDFEDFLSDKVQNYSKKIIEEFIL